MTSLATQTMEEEGAMEDMKTDEDLVVATRREGEWGMKEVEELKMLALR